MAVVRKIKKPELILEEYKFLEHQSYCNALKGFACCCILKKKKDIDKIKVIQNSAY
ncbi:hypothetical protein ACFL35_08370 [Candidatus Riflebacteria bacterium]